MLAGGLVFLAVLAERFFGFELHRRQWIGIGLVAVSLSVLTLIGGGGGEANSGDSLAGMIVFEGIAVGVGLLLTPGLRLERGRRVVLPRRSRFALSETPGRQSSHRSGLDRDQRRLRARAAAAFGHPH